MNICSSCKWVVGSRVSRTASAMSFGYFPAPVPPRKQTIRNCSRRGPALPHPRRPGLDRRRESVNRARCVTTRIAARVLANCGDEETPRPPSSPTARGRSPRQRYMHRRVHNLRIAARIEPRGRSSRGRRTSNRCRDPRRTSSAATQREADRHRTFRGDRQSAATSGCTLFRLTAGNRRRQHRTACVPGPALPKLSSHFRTRQLS